MIKQCIRKCLSKDLYQNLSDIWYALLARLLSLLPINQNKIFITNYFGKGFGDNGKYIYQELVRQKINCDVVWQLEHPELDARTLPSEIRTVKYKSLKALYEMQTASVWVDNCRKMFGYKRKKQLYIQTWHGGPGVKRVEKDVEGALNSRYRRFAIKDSRMCDLMVSNSDFMTNLFTNAFWYSGTILKTGTPRNDILCGEQPEIRKTVRKFYRLKESIRILLYAPTFRHNKSLVMYNLDKCRTLQALQQRFGGEWVILTRLHPNIRDKADQLMCTNDWDINATLYPDMQELLAACDCLITDYSSSDVDFLLTHRPCFVYAPDIEQYRSDRGYYFQWEELPFTIAKTNDTLISNILTFDESAFSSNVNLFMKATGMFDIGEGSKKVVYRIQQHIQKK